MKAGTALCRILALMLLVLGIISIQNNRAHAQVVNDPERNFEFLWKALDLNYALFKAKHIDWQALYNIYRPLVTERTTDEELFAIMTKMLGHLNDNHVRLSSATPERFFEAGYLGNVFGKAGIKKLRALLSNRPVPDKHFKEALKETGDKIFAYGWLDDTIGYFHCNAFINAESSTKAIDEIMMEFKNARALVVDVRRNSGGDDLISKLIASRFADQKRLYMTTQDRCGPSHDDFDPKKHFFVEPDGPRQFTKTVVLLANRLSISAAEDFIMAMRILPHVTVVGDFTSGCFADKFYVELPNGWKLSLSMSLFLDQNGFCWEGIGVPPDIKISCDYNEVVPENDPALATAISLIKSGNLSLQDEHENTGPTQSLAHLLENDMASGGIENAIARFNDRKAHDPDGIYYLDFYELVALARKLFATNKNALGEGVLSLTSRLFPEVSAIYDVLGIEYIKQNKKIAAWQALEKAVALKSIKTMPQSRQFDEYLVDVLVLENLSGGIDALDRQYLSLKEKYPRYVTEPLLNELGYLFLYNNLTGPAIQVLKLNVKKFPQSANTYDSLGEAYMNAGNKRLAIWNYEKSLKLNPNNAYGKENLKKLKGEK
jgi:carboxyl-terminal processing protease